MIMPEEHEIEENGSEVLEKLTYGKTTLSLLDINGDYQIEKERSKR